MPYAVEHTKFLQEVERSKALFDPRIHGAYGSPDYERFPIDCWAGSERGEPHLSELIYTKGAYCGDYAVVYQPAFEMLLPVLSSEESTRFTSSLSYLFGMDPQSKEIINRYWKPEEMGSDTIYYVYSPQDCSLAHRAVSGGRFIDLLQLAKERDFLSSSEARPVCDDREFWRIVRGDLEGSYGIHSFHDFEADFLRHVKYCSEKELVLVQDILEV